jgi:hypothetical protein
MRTLEEWLRVPASVLYVVAEPNAVEQVLRAKGIKHVRLRISKDESRALLDIRNGLDVADHVPVYRVGLVLADCVRRGITALIEIEESCSLSMQISLQEGIDWMAQQSMFRPDEWMNAGTLLLMGSSTDVVRLLILSRTAPLYQRVTATVHFPEKDVKG